MAFQSVARPRPTGCFEMARLRTNRVAAHPVVAGMQAASRAGRMVTAVTVVAVTVVSVGLVDLLWRYRAIAVIFVVWYLSGTRPPGALASACLLDTPTQAVDGTQWL